MNIHNKYRTVRSVGEDCHDEKDLKTLIADKHDPICFKRFQPSGLMHIAEVEFRYVILVLDFVVTFQISVLSLV